MWYGHERIGFRIPIRRPLAVERALETNRGRVGQCDRNDREAEDAPAPPERTQDERNRPPEQPKPARIGKALEDRIEPVGAVVDEPTLELAVC